MSVTFIRVNNSQIGIFKGDGSLDVLSKRLLERLKLFWTSQMPGYLMEPNRGNKDFKEAVRNAKNGPKQPKWKKGSF